MDGGSNPAWDLHSFRRNLVRLGIQLARVISDITIDKYENLVGCLQHYYQGKILWQNRLKFKKTPYLVQLDDLILEKPEPQVLRVGHTESQKVDRKRCPLVKPRDVMSFPHWLRQQGHQRGMQLHQSLVLRQTVKLFLGVPPMQSFNHLVQLYNLLLQLDQAKVLGVRDLERMYIF